MRQVVERVIPDYAASLVERDVRDEAEWRRRYLWEIPVLLLGEQELARHRVSEAELRKRLEPIGRATAAERDVR
jgi:hypothetical protein